MRHKLPLAFWALLVCFADVECAVVRVAREARVARERKVQERQTPERQTPEQQMQPQHFFPQSLADAMRADAWPCVLWSLCRVRPADLTRCDFFGNFIDSEQRLSSRDALCARLNNQTELFRRCAHVLLREATWELTEDEKAQWTASLFLRRPKNMHLLDQIDFSIGHDQFVDAVSHICTVASDWSDQWTTVMETVECLSDGALARESRPDAHAHKTRAAFPHLQAEGGWTVGQVAALEAFLVDLLLAVYPTLRGSQLQSDEEAANLLLVHVFLFVPTSSIRQMDMLFSRLALFSRAAWSGYRQGRVAALEALLKTTLEKGHVFVLQVFLFTQAIETSAAMLNHLFSLNPPLSPEMVKSIFAGCQLDKQLENGLFLVHHVFSHGRDYFSLLLDCEHIDWNVGDEDGYTVLGRLMASEDENRLSLLAKLVSQPGIKDLCQWDDTDSRLGMSNVADRLDILNACLEMADFDEAARTLAVCIYQPVLSKDPKRWCNYFYRAVNADRDDLWMGIFNAHLEEDSLERLRDLFQQIFKELKMLFVNPPRGAGVPWPAVARRHERELRLCRALQRLLRYLTNHKSGRYCVLLASLEVERKEVLRIMNCRWKREDLRAQMNQPIERMLVRQCFERVGRFAVQACFSKWRALNGGCKESATEMDATKEKGSFPSLEHESATERPLFKTRIVPKIRPLPATKGTGNEAWFEDEW